MSEPLRYPACSPPLPWQSVAWERLGRQASQAVLPHAILLTGTPGTGRERFAIALARMLLCENPDGGLNCGRCHACELSAAGSHADLRWLGPEGKSKQIKVDSIREAVTFAGKTASQGHGKVIVFSPAEAMNVSAANALLKCLEEPPAGTYLVLVSAQPHRIPATVRSRCQQLALPTPSWDEGLAWLDGATGSRAESEKWLKLANGLPLLAEAWLNAPDGEAQVASRLACASLVAGKIKVSEALAMLESSDLAQVLQQVASVISEYIRAADDSGLRSRRGRAIFSLYDEVLRLQRAVNSGSNPNRQLICEVILEKLLFLLGQSQTGDSIAP